MTETNIGDQVQFQCQVGGSEPLNVEWRLADGSIPPSGVVQSGNDIVLAQVESSHAGTYVCSVQNLVGTVEDRAVLNVFRKFVVFCGEILLEPWRTEQ